MIKPELRDDLVSFPSPETVRRASFYAPLSPEGELRYQRVWERVLADGE